VPDATDTTERAAQRRQNPASQPGRSWRRRGADLRGERGARVLERPAHLRDLGDARHEDQNCAGLPSARWFASALRCLQMSDVRASVGEFGPGSDVAGRSRKG
jgi:hypothetical protein